MVAGGYPVAYNMANGWHEIRIPTPQKHACHTFYRLSFTRGYDSPCCTRQAGKVEQKAPLVE